MIKRYPGISSVTTIDSFFSSTYNSQDQIDYLSKAALSRGLDKFTNQDYAAAITEFKTVIGLSTFSDNASNAYDYMAKSYEKTGKTDQAIGTYKEAIRVFPQADNLHLSLGDIYSQNGRQADAQKEYEAAVKLNPNSPDGRYALGETYMTAGRLDEAKAQFSQVVRLSPNSATGYYGLGQTYRKMGDYSDAVTQLGRAIGADKNFQNSYRELGYTYVDSGDMKNAQQQADILQGMNSSLTSSLQDYMYKATAPKILAAFSPDGFDTALMSGTPVSKLDPLLSTPGGSKTFSMEFVFSKEMDTASVQNLANWEIARQYGASAGGDYNFGMPLPSTEVQLPALPDSVSYDPQTHIALVTFGISQNSTANSTIDPEHVMFKFDGADAYGKAMDPAADEYSGFSLIA